MNISLIAINARFTHSCLALFYVRNELEIHCPEAQLSFLELTINDSFYETLLRITETQPDFVFFSAYIWNSDLVEKMIRDLRVCLPGCSCVVGGPQAAIIAGHLEEGECTVVIGPIETLGAVFYHDLHRNGLKPLYNNGSIVQMNSFSSPYRDSDFARHLKNRHVYYESSRGCPFSCTYCLSAAQKGVLHKELTQVEVELNHILSHQPAALRFVDRTFNDNPERALAIWRFLAAKKTNTLFHFEISPERFNEETISFLGQVRPGMFQFEIGIQSTNPETLKAVRRPMETHNAHSIVSRLASLGNIHLHVDLILGLPYETKKTFLQSFAQVFSMGAHYIQMGLLKILPGTPLCNSTRDFAYQSSCKPPYAIISNQWMDHETLSDLYWFCECVERFMNNRYFVTLWKYLRRKNENSIVFFRDLQAVCRNHSFFSLASTQELMCRMLLEATAKREDAGVLFDLIRFDWLRCGHRFLPECLQIHGEIEEPSLIKKKLFKSLPESIKEVYDRAERSQFCKKGLFVEFSEKSMIECGFYDHRERGLLCFLPEREATLHGFNRVIRISLNNKH